MCKIPKRRCHFLSNNSNKFYAVMYVKHEIGTETTNTNNKNSLDFDLSSTPIRSRSSKRLSIILTANIFFASEGTSGFYLKKKKTIYRRSSFCLFVCLSFSPFFPLFFFQSENKKLGSGVQNRVVIT